MDLFVIVNVLLKYYIFFFIFIQVSELRETANELEIPCDASTCKSSYSKTSKMVDIQFQAINNAFSIILHFSTCKRSKTCWYADFSINMHRGTTGGIR